MQFIVDKHKYVYYSSHISAAVAQQQVAERNHSHAWSTYNVTIVNITGHIRLYVPGVSKETILALLLCILHAQRDISLKIIKNIL